MTNGQNHVVVIFNDGNTAAVAPGQVVAANGDTVTFRNITRTPVTLVLPDKKIFKDSSSVDLIPEDQKPFPEVQLTVDADEVGNYPYTVYHSSQKEFGHASIPNIIVYRRD